MAGFVRASMPIVFDKPTTISASRVAMRIIADDGAPSRYEAPYAHQVM
jgi:hypothetical protein